MHIPSHQVLNVLKAYKKMVIRKKSAAEGESGAESDRFSGKRQAVVENIIKEIAARIMQVRKKPAAPRDFGEEALSSGTLTYHIMTENGKETRTITPDAADFLIGNLERLAGKSDPETENS